MFPLCLPVRMFGADDFLPMLTYVLVQCDMPQLDTEILYMMELIDPPLLHGEGALTCTCVIMLHKPEFFLKKVQKCIIWKKTTTSEPKHFI